MAKIPNTQDLKEKSPIQVTQIRQALLLSNFDSRHAHMQMAPQPRDLYRVSDRPGKPHLGGVLILLYPQAEQLFFVLTRRTETLENHRGQISLPGGSRDRGETLAETAIREACEELGVCLSPKDIVGQLAPLYIPPSDFEIHPFVLYYPRLPEFVPEPAEVAELVQVPLNTLLEPLVHRKEEWRIREVDVHVPFYYLYGHKVWGATAMVLSELEQRLRVVLAG